jgi:hypothetical protein
VCQRATRREGAPRDCLPPREALSRVPVAAGATCTFRGCLLRPRDALQLMAERRSSAAGNVCPTSVHRAERFVVSATLRRSDRYLSNRRTGRKTAAMHRSRKITSELRNQSWSSGQRGRSDKKSEEGRTNVTSLGGRVRCPGDRSHHVQHRWPAPLPTCPESASSARSPRRSGRRSRRTDRVVR